VTPRLPRISSTETIKAPMKAGFEQVGQRGSHVKLRNAAGRTVIVPMHPQLASRTLRSILRQADLSPEELSRLL
jgi:predicted RNA binding protein YcfA (HicA-like mRNA interferase family)